MVDDAYPLQVGEVVPEADTDDLDAVGDGTGGEFGGHRVTGGQDVCGIAAELDGSEVFEVEKEQGALAVAHRDQGREWSGDTCSVVS